MVFNSLHDAAEHISRNQFYFNGRRVGAFGCANAHVFNTLMREFDRMNTCDIDCGVTFTGKAMLGTDVFDIITILYKLPDGRPEIREHIAGH